MSEFLTGDRKEALKGIILSLHQGADLEAVKARFEKVLEGVTPVEIARVEEELIKEGLPRDEVHRLCEVHLAAFRESLEAERPLAPAGHPVHILMEEHRILTGYAGELKSAARKLKDAGRLEPSILTHLHHLEKHLKDSESHYVREENVLFPSLEKHGITQPPAIMWMEHDQIRQTKKRLYGHLESYTSVEFGDFARGLDEVASSLAELLPSHFHKENSVLFPVSLRVIPEAEWKDIRLQFDELGYCCFTPGPARKHAEEAPAQRPGAEAVAPFETGALSWEQVEAILNALPVDITFVDKNDTVRYFNKGEERIFPRTRAIIGIKVQQCHPQKSIDVVNRILEDFRGGRRSLAEFWIQQKGRFVHIRYFPLRGKGGEYLGTMEVTQDITSIKKLEGEKRLLDEAR